MVQPSASVPEWQLCSQAFQYHSRYGATGTGARSLRPCRACVWGAEPRRAGTASGMRIADVSTVTRRCVANRHGDWSEQSLCQYLGR
eukprot:751183-Rhodomonas_salina.5